jgi:AAA family ATP:ADP antiporter
MSAVLQRALGLDRRELTRALPLFGYLFLATAGAVASKSARDALFLDEFGATALPYVDISIAVLVGVAAGIYIRLGHRTSLRNLQMGSLLFFAVSAFGLWTWSVTEGESRAHFVIIYIWVGVLAVLVPSQVWMLANYVMTTREAKRAFGLIGSGAILGWIVGGYLTRTIVGRFGTESMLVWVTAVLIVCTGLVFVIWRDRPDYVDRDHAATTARDTGGLLRSADVVRGSPYLRAIAFLVLLSALATTVAGWQFKAIAKAAIPDTDELAVFFGTFNMVAGLVSLVVQLLLTGRVLKGAGVGTALFIVPIALLGGSIGVLAFGTLLAASILKAGDQVLRYSIDKATVELLYLPVSAAQTFRVKSFIDTVVYRIGDAAGGALVLLFATVLGWSPVTVSWVSVVTIAGWMVAAAVARRRYVDNLRDSIHQHRVDAEKATAPVIAKETAAILSSRLEGEPDEIAYALSLFEMAHDHAVHPAVRGLLKHPRPGIRRQAIALLARAGDASVKGEVEKLLRDPELEVRTEALLYMTAHESTDPLDRIQALGDFGDFSIRAAIVAFLARPGRAQNLDAARVMLAAMVKDSGEAGARTRLEAARLLGWLPDAFERELRPLIDDEDLEVAKAAIAAVGRLKKRALVAAVLARIAEPPLSGPITDALAALGDRIVGVLRDELLDPSTSIEVRRLIPGVLQAIGTTAAQVALAEVVLERDVVLRYNVIAALNKLAQLHPEPLANRVMIESLLEAEVMGHYRSYQVLGSMSTLEDVASNPVLHGLRESMTKEGERIFRLLKILHPNRDMHSAYVGLRSSDPIVHDNAVEFLDTILGPGLRTRLLPLFDRDVKPAQRVETANRVLGAVLGDRAEAVAVMTLSEDPWLRSCAAYAIGDMQLTQFAALLDQWTRDPDPLLRATAIDARDKLKEAAAYGGGLVDGP